MNATITKSKRIAAGILVVVFLAILGAPTLENSIPMDPVKVSGENRTLSPWPGFPDTWTKLIAFPKQFTDYYQDHFGFRGTLVGTYHWLGYFFKINRYNTQIIVGKEGRLYKNSGDGLCDLWRGATPFTETELTHWENTLRERQEWMEKRGGKYLYLIVPDRQAMEPEFLPNRIHKSFNKNRLEQLYDYLKNQAPDLNVIDLRPVLRKTDLATYPISDTHWNEYGAYLGYREIITHLSQWFTLPAAYPISEFTITTEEVPGQILADMIVAQNLIHDSLVLVTPKHKRTAQEAYEGMPPSVAGQDPRPAWKPRAYITKDPKLPRAILLCDSMEARLSPFLAEHFSWMGVYRQDAFDPELVEWAHADIVIQERSEEYALPFLPKNDPKLLQSSPKNINGWAPHCTVLKPFQGDTPPEMSDTSVLHCSTSDNNWAGVLYGCTAPNHCDEHTLSCNPETSYKISLWVKGIKNFAGVPVQLHVIGDHGKNFGTASCILSNEWQLLQHPIATDAQTHYLGIQFVKRNHKASTDFLISTPALTNSQ